MDSGPLEARPGGVVGSAPTERAPLCFAHRGARAHAPENTLLAFALAFDLGAEVIECDVQRTRDGHLVILHDATLQRTTDGTGLLSTWTLDDLRRLNAGVHWHLRQSVPTLDETLALVRARGRAVNLEVKAEREQEAVATAEALVPALVGLEPAMRQRVLVSSFALPAIAAVKRLAPEVRVAALFGQREW